MLFQRVFLLSLFSYAFSAVANLRQSYNVSSFGAISVSLLTSINYDCTTMLDCPLIYDANGNVNRTVFMSLIHSGSFTVSNITNPTPAITRVYSPFTGFCQSCEIYGPSSVICPFLPSLSTSEYYALDCSYDIRNVTTPTLPSTTSSIVTTAGSVATYCPACAHVAGRYECDMDNIFTSTFLCDLLGSPAIYCPNCISDVSLRRVTCNMSSPTVDMYLLC